MDDDDLLGIRVLQNKDKGCEMVIRIKRGLAILMLVMFSTGYLVSSFAPVAMASPDFETPHFDPPKIKPPKRMDPPKPVPPPKPPKPPKTMDPPKVKGPGVKDGGTGPGGAPLPNVVGDTPEQSLFDRLFDPKKPATGNDGYKVAKYMFKDVYIGIAKFLEPTVAEAAKSKSNPLYIPEYFKNADGISYYSLLSPIVRGSLGMSAESGGLLQKFVDFWGIADQASGVFKVDFSKAVSVFQAAQVTTEGFEKISALQKAKLIGLNAFSNVKELKGFISLKEVAVPATALDKFAGVVGLVISTGETVYNGILLTQAEDFSKEQADALLGVMSGIGGIISGAAVFVAAVCPLAAAIMVVVGLLIVVVATIAKYFTKYKVFAHLVTFRFVMLKRFVTDPLGSLKKIYAGSTAVGKYLANKAAVGARVVGRGTKLIVEGTIGLARVGRKRLVDGLSIISGKVKGWFGG